MPPSDGVGSVSVMMVGGGACLVLCFLSDMVCFFLSTLAIHAAVSGSVDTQNRTQVGQPQRAMSSMTAPASDGGIEKEMCARRITGMAAGTQCCQPVTPPLLPRCIVTVQNSSNGMYQLDVERSAACGVSGLH